MGFGVPMTPITLVAPVVRSIETSAEFPQPFTLSPPTSFSAAKA